MAERHRYFQNELPDYSPELLAATTGNEPSKASNRKKKRSEVDGLIWLPYTEFSKTIKSSGLQLKNSVVRETWLSCNGHIRDYSLYTGALGTAFLLFKSYQVTKDNNDLKLCSEIVETCASVSRGSGRVTFICGTAGIYALGAVVAKYSNDNRKLNQYLMQFNEIKLPTNLPNELLYGRAGFLWSCSFLNHHIGKESISASLRQQVVDEIIKSGRDFPHKGNCPLMYEWHGKRYWGAAHGLAGIMHVLMDMELKPDEAEDVKGTLRYMIKNRFASGNFPSSEGRDIDQLVHWCHGAPGIALTLVKAAEVFGDNEFLQAAQDAAEVVWNRGLLTRVGICHGISGNAYVFLALYRLTQQPQYLHRAKAFACFLNYEALSLISKNRMSGGDSPYSLFEGIGGMAYLFLDMVNPLTARFPAYEM